MTYDNLFNALGDSTRRHIFEALRDSPRTVGELSLSQPVSRPAVSQHLKILQEAGLVKVRPEGTRRYYSVKPDALATLRRYLDMYWSNALSAYGDEVNRRKRSEENAGSDSQDH